MRRVRVRKALIEAVVAALIEAVVAAKTAIVLIRAMRADGTEEGS